MNRHLRQKLVAGVGGLSILLGAFLVFAPGAGADPQFDETLFDSHLKDSHHGALASTYGNQEKDCADWVDGDGTTSWHFVLQGDAEFEELWVQFDTEVDPRGPLTPGAGFIAHPNAQHAYVETTGDATLVDAVANISGTDPDFNLSHVCTPTETTSSTTTPSTTTPSTTTPSTTTPSTTTPSTTTPSTTTPSTTTPSTTTPSTTTPSTTTPSTTTPSTTTPSTTTPEDEVISDNVTTTTVADATTTTGPVVLDNTVNRSQALAKTGSEPRNLAGVGIAFMVLGAIIVGGSRRQLADG
ncbi:hypothetical protein [Actinospongicola halichondriae]|uniref:hypothetical protein n=1 Tax=Actinospongicola halichondriae TaxID=3236844 RepID=UPI003D4C9743